MAKTTRKKVVGMRTFILVLMTIALLGCFKTVIIRPVIDVRDPIPKGIKLDDQRQDKGFPSVDEVRPERALRRR